MNVFVITGVIPFRSHGLPDVTAVHIVSNEIIKGLADRGHRVILQVLFSPLRKEPALSAEEQAELDRLRRDGVEVLPPITPDQYRLPPGGPVRRLAYLFRRAVSGERVEDFYGAARAAGTLAERLARTRSDLALSVWNPEGAAAMHSLKGVHKALYHGDVDFMPWESRMKDPAIFPPVGPLGRLRHRARLAQMKRVHLKMMRGIDLIANVTAFNAEYYSANGHPRSIYIRNTWIDAGLHPPAPLSGRIKIIGHLGKLGATGGTYGLWFLLTKLLPALREELRGLDYEVHVIGGGKISPALAPLLRQERLVVRGFVEDLDAELRSSNVFLLLNNAGSYIAAYTRHLVAWSTGLCLVAHANSQRAIPEVRHLENALTGTDPRELARWIRKAATDEGLNRRIREGGRRTYELFFTPRRVTEHLARELELLTGKGPELHNVTAKELA